MPAVSSLRQRTVHYQVGAIDESGVTEGIVRTNGRLPQVSYPVLVDPAGLHRFEFSAADAMRLEHRARCKVVKRIKTARSLARILHQGPR